MLFEPKLQHGLHNRALGSKTPIWSVPNLVLLIVPRLRKTTARLFVCKSRSVLTSCESDPPDSVPVSEFILSEKHGRAPYKKSRNPFTCGLSGKTYTVQEHADRVELLARSLSQEFKWDPNEGTEWDKVIGIFALNTVCGIGDLRIVGLLLKYFTSD